MNDLKNKLLSLKETKGLIREAIVDREVAVPEGTPFRDYANRIRAIPLGGAAALNIAYGDKAPEDTSKLWVKGDAPKVVRIDSGGKHGDVTVDFGVGQVYEGCNFSAVAIGTKIYMFGGSRNSNWESDKIYSYDIETGKITDYSGVLTQGAVIDTAAVAVNGKAYIFGGKSYGTYSGTYYHNQITEFDPSTGKTNCRGYMDQDGANIGAAAVGDLVYLFGGYDDGDMLSRIAVYNTKTALFTRMSHGMPELIYGVSCAAVGDKIYLFGGYAKRDGTGQSVKTCYVYDTAEADQSRALRKLEAELPTSGYGFPSVAIGKYVYCLRGPYLYRFDTETETFTNLGAATPNNATGPAAVAIGECIYYIGGKTYYNYTYEWRDSVDRLSFKSVLPEGEMLLAVVPNGQQVELVKMANMNMRLGIRGVYRGNSEGIAEKAQAYLWGIRDILHGYESASQVNSGTELTAEVESKAGQLVVAAIAARDSFTVSAGWTLLSTSEVNSTDSTGQRLAFAYKVATGNTEAITVTQQSEQRMYINMVSLDGATGVTDNGYTYKNTETEATISAAKPTGLTLWACSAPLWSSVLPYPQWEADNDPYRIDLGERVQSRLAIFLDQSEAETVTFTAASNSTAIVGCLTVEGMGELYDGDGSGWCEIK